MKKIALFLTLTFAFGQGMAAQPVENNPTENETFIVKATNDEDEDITRLYLILDKNKDIQQFRVRTLAGEEIIEDDLYGVDKGESGIVLKNLKGKDIVTLYSSNFTGHQGGEITLRYLFNGLTGSTKELELDLGRYGDNWVLNINGQKATHLHFQSNKKFMIGAIGVKRVVIVE